MARDDYPLYVHWSATLDNLMQRVESFPRNARFTLASRIVDAGLDVMERIVDNGGADGKGLPVGNLTSQFLANVYLDPLDHWIKERQRLRGYLRYMDDFVLFDDDPLALDAHRTEIEAFLADALRLKAKQRATCLNRTGHGLSFLGRRIFPNALRLSGEGWRRNRRRLRHAVAEWEADLIDEQTLSARLASLIGHRDGLKEERPRGLRAGGGLPHPGPLCAL